MAFWALGSRCHAERVAGSVRHQGSKPARPGPGRDEPAVGVHLRAGPAVGLERVGGHLARQPGPHPSPHTRTFHHVSSFE